MLIKIYGKEQEEANAAASASPEIAFPSNWMDGGCLCAENYIATLSVVSSCYYSSRLYPLPINARKVDATRWHNFDRARVTRHARGKGQVLTQRQGSRARSSVTNGRYVVSLIDAGFTLPSQLLSRKHMRICVRTVYRRLMILSIICRAAALHLWYTLHFKIFWI